LYAAHSVHIRTLYTRSKPIRCTLSTGLHPLHLTLVGDFHFALLDTIYFALPVSTVSVLGGEYKINTPYEKVMVCTVWWINGPAS
jgi:hypothetical protein